MDAEVSCRLKYGCLSCGRLAPRLMVVSSEMGSVWREALQHFCFFFQWSLLISDKCEFTLKSTINLHHPHWHWAFLLDMRELSIFPQILVTGIGLWPRTHCQTIRTSKLSSSSSQGQISLAVLTIRYYLLKRKLHVSLSHCVVFPVETQLWK